MLQFFRINDPFRLIGVAIILLLLRIPVIIHGGPLLFSELNWMLIGESLASGDTLYLDLWDNIAPLAATSYWFMHVLFGKSQLAFQIVALFLVFIQSVQFNSMLIRNNAYNEPSYIPAALYVIIGTSFFDFMTLSPQLIALTFILPALNNTFRHIEFRAKHDSQIINIGLSAGLASLFYLPSVLVMLGIISVLASFTSTLTRRYYLMALGFVVPFLAAFGYYGLVHKSGESFVQLFLGNFNKFSSAAEFEFLDYTIVFAVPVFLSVMMYFRLFGTARLNNYQSRLIQVITLLIVFLCGIYFVEGDKGPATFWFFVPVAAFLIGHLLLMVGKRLANLLFLLVFASAIFTNVLLYYNVKDVAQIMSIENFKVEHSPLLDLNKKLLVLGDEASYYLNQSLATPFLNWNIASDIFENPDSYEKVAILFEAFSQDPPEIIVDKSGLMPQVFSHLPTIQNQYRKSGNYYYRISN